MPPRFWSLTALAALLAVAAGFMAWGGMPPLGIAALILAGGVTLVLADHALRHDAPVPAADLAAPLPGRAAPPPPPGAADAGRSLLEHLPSPVFLIERGGRISFANRAALDLFPRLGNAQHYASLLRAPPFVDAVSAAFASGEARATDFTHFQSGDLHLRAHVSPTGPPGSADPVVVMVEDRTADVRIEALRSDFVANASHEVRTPLAAIIGAIETLRGPARDDPAGRDRFLGVMERQAERMKRLVEDLLSLSQIELSEHVAPRTLCDLHDTAREAAAALAPLVERRGMRIETRLPDRPVAVRGDRDQLVQVFVNLLENALKYAGAAGPVLVEMAMPDPRHPGMTGVSVTDRGPGIAREHVPRLTERFYRVSAQASREQGGTGLGLAIVKHVLNRHRGELQIESTPGKGSRFTVWLPVPQGVTEEGQAEPRLEKAM